MAFYQDIKGKSRQERRADAIARGGFDDEGANYRKGSRTAGNSRNGSKARNSNSNGYTGGSSRNSSYNGGGSSRNGSYNGGGSSRNSSYNGGGSSRNNNSYNSGSSSRNNSYNGGSNSRNSSYNGGSNSRNSSYNGGSNSRNSAYNGGSSRNSSYNGGGSRNTPAHNSTPAPRSASYKDNAVRHAPHGERIPAPPAPRSNPRAGSYRFADGEPTRYTARGDRTTPIPYDEQRRLRQQAQSDALYDQYRYTPAEPVSASEPDDLADTLLSGRNPIREALKSGRDIEKLMVARGDLSGSAREIVQMARERHIPVQEVDRARLDAITRNHQGMLAFASAYQYSTVEDMLQLAASRGEAPFLILLDGVTDPHNVGAIIRTAECAGAHGVVVQERRAAGLTPAAVKASAGAIEYIPVARVTNLTATIEQLKRQNIWVFAADMDGEPYASADLSGAVALVIGAEGEGVSRLVRQACDKTLSLPLRGKLDSLNASVAAGVLMYAVMRAR